MLPDVRMIRRALIGEIQRNINPLAFRSRYKAPKIVESSKLGVNGLVSALLGTDRPRASGLAGRGFARVVFPFAMGVPDRMNRRKVNNVEAHFSDFGNDALAIFECPAGPWKHFVPGTKCFHGPAGHSKIASASFPKSLKWASTLFTFLLFIRSGTPIAKGKTTRAKPRPASPEARGRSVPKRADTRPFTPSLELSTIFGAL